MIGKGGNQEKDCVFKFRWVGVCERGIFSVPSNVLVMNPAQSGAVYEFLSLAFVHDDGYPVGCSMSMYRM